MMKCRRRQATDPQKLKKFKVKKVVNGQRSFSRFSLVEAETVEVEAIGVEAEAVDEIAASTSVVSISPPLHVLKM